MQDSGYRKNSIASDDLGTGVDIMIRRGASRGVLGGLSSSTISGLVWTTLNGRMATAPAAPCSRLIYEDGPIEWPGRVLYRKQGKELYGTITAIRADEELLTCASEQLGYPKRFWPLLVTTEGFPLPHRLILRIKAMLREPGYLTGSAR